MLLAWGNLSLLLGMVDAVFNPFDASPYYFGITGVSLMGVVFTKKLPRIPGAQ